MKLERSLTNVESCAEAEDREGRHGLESNHLSLQLLIATEKRKVKTNVEYIAKERWGGSAHQRPTELGKGAIKECTLPVTTLVGTPE
jgi:hypothetical protein